MYRRLASLCVVLVTALLCTLSPAHANEVLATSERALSPNYTSNSLGAQLEEVALGDLVADALREESASDIALTLGGHLVQSLPAGEITTDDVDAIFDELHAVMVVELSVQELFEILEHGLSYISIDEAEAIDPDSGFYGFPQISGLCISYDVSQAPGARIRTLALKDGTQLAHDSELTVTAALPEDMLDGSLGFPVPQASPRTTESTEAELLARFLSEEGQVSIPTTTRTEVMGTSSQTLYETFQLGQLLPYIIVLILLIRLPALFRKDARTQISWARRS